MRWPICNRDLRTPGERHHALSCSSHCACICRGAQPASRVLGARSRDGGGNDRRCAAERRESTQRGREPETTDARRQTQQQIEAPRVAPARLGPGATARSRSMQPSPHRATPVLPERIRDRNHHPCAADPNELERIIATVTDLARDSHRPLSPDDREIIIDLHHRVADRLIEYGAVRIGSPFGSRLPCAIPDGSV